VVLPATDIAYGGALGIDRAFGPNLRLGAFAGGGASREDVELSVQSIDSTYAFGGGYGRFDWATQYLDFSLYGGSISNSSTRGIANNTVASGFETATASYGGWFISPTLSYGYRIPFSNDILMTPRVSVRYVGGSLDGQRDRLGTGSQCRPARHQRSRRTRRSGIFHAQAGVVGRHGQVDDRRGRDRA
jgi:uncharacterized protein with beta-barrel porin domain